MRKRPIGLVFIQGPKPVLGGNNRQRGNIPRRLFPRTGEWKQSSRGNNRRRLSKQGIRDGAVCLFNCSFIFYMSLSKTIQNNDCNNTLVGLENCIKITSE